MKKLQNKILAAVVCFLFMGNSLVFAQQTSTVSDSSPISTLNPSAGRVPIDPNASSLGSVLNPYNISIPEQFGQVEEVFQGDANSPLVVHIQNVHANYEAQVNIKGILNHLVDAYQFSLIQLEGAVSKLDPAILQPSYLKEANLKLVDFLMREGRITGADAFAVETTKPVELYGIEDFSLYAENLKMFKSIYKHQVELKPYFDEVHRLVLNVGPKLLNPELLDFTRKTEEFSTDKIDFLDYLVYMNQLSEKHKLVSLNELPTMVDYPNLTRLMRLRNLEEKLNKAGLKKETEAIKAEFHKKMPNSEKVEELLSHLDESAKGVNPRTYFLELTQLANEAKIDFIAYPAFRIFAEFLIHQDEIDHRVLFAEIKQFESMLQEKLFTTADEKMFLSIIDRVGLLEQFFRLEMSREKIALYLKDRETVPPSRIFSDLDELAKKLTVISKAVGDLRKLDSYMADVEYFYQLVLKRDEIFIDKILSKTKSLSLDKTIIVTGGFHKDGLVDYFRKEKISYVIVNPKVDVKEGNQNYLKVMLEDDVVAGSVFAGTFAIEGPNYGNPGRELPRAQQVVGPGILLLQRGDLSPDNLDVPKANQRLQNIAGLNLEIRSTSPISFTNRHTAVTRFYGVDGKPHAYELEGEVDQNGVFSEKVVREVPVSEVTLNRLGIVRPNRSFPSNNLNDLPNIEVTASSLQNPSRIFSPEDLFDFPLGITTVPKPPKSATTSFLNEKGQQIRQYFEVLADASPAEAKSIQEKIAEIGIPSVEVLQALRNESVSRGRAVVDLNQVTQANLPAGVANRMSFLNSPNEAVKDKPVFFVFALSSGEVGRAEARAVIQILTTNPQNMAAVVYGPNAKQVIADVLGVSIKEMESRVELVSRLITVEADRGVSFGSKTEAFARMQKELLSGAIFNRLRAVSFARPLSLDEVMKHLGVLIEMTEAGDIFSKRLADVRPDTVQLLGLSEEDAAFAGDVDKAAAVFFAAIKIIANITGVEASALLRRIDAAGLSQAMKNLNRNQWALVAAAVSILVETVQHQRQFEVAA